MQLSASFSGALSGSGNVLWWRRLNRRDVSAIMSVSRLDRDVSRVRRTSIGEKRLKTSSADSGSCQNYEQSVHRCLRKETTCTPVQYASSAGIVFGSESLKMPCLKTSLESDCPMVAYGSLVIGHHRA